MEINFKVTENEANIILNALIHQPYMTVANLIDKLQNQAKEQTENKTTK